jgi:N-acetyl-alpha-D-muramate 1-phosphate uridylyltransferase
MLIDTAIVLAAGRGERLQPLTNTLAQALVPVAGRSLLERSIDRLNQHAVKNIVVNVHHLGHQIADRLNGRARIVHEECLLGTGGSVKNALTLLGGGPFFVLNGDTLWTDGPQPMLKRLEDRWDPRRMDALLLLHPIHKIIGREPLERGNYFFEAGNLLRHRGSAQLCPHIFSGASVCDERLFRHSPDGPFSLLQLWHQAEAVKRLYGVTHDASWCHVATPHALAEVDRALASV